MLVCGSLSKPWDVRAFTQKSSNILPITRFELKLETSARVCVFNEYAQGYTKYKSVGEAMQHIKV